LQTRYSAAMIGALCRPCYTYGMMKKRGLRKTPALAAVVGAVLALTACRSGDNSGEHGNGGAAGTQTVTV